MESRSNRDRSHYVATIMREGDSDRLYGRENLSVSSPISSLINEETDGLPYDSRR
jgi:hypothetical protein